MAVYIVYIGILYMYIIGWNLQRGDAISGGRETIKN